MNRRDAVISLFALGGLQCVNAQAERKKVRIGILLAGSPEATGNLVAAFIARMKELGWIEGSTVEYFIHYARGETKAYSTIATEMFALSIDLLLAPYGYVALAAMKISRDVPIVFCIVEDPVTMGLVASLGRPGGNLTGVTTGGEKLVAKRLQVLKEVVPSVRRLGILHGNPSAQVVADLARLRQAAKQFGIEVVVEQFDSADMAVSMNRLLLQKVDATVGTTSMHWSIRKEFVGLVTKAGLPAIYDAEEFVNAGGLMSISVRYADRYRAAAGHVDRILRGAKPRDLPVEEPTVLTTAVSLRAARALGLKIPQAILVSADKVIE